jgi:hypothetical protein
MSNEITTIYPDEPCLIPVVYESNPLTVYDKDYSDIEEVLMCFKQKPTDSEDKYIVKYYKDGSGGGIPSGGVLINEATHTFTMNKLETDVVMPSTTLYSMHIGVKVQGLSKYLTLRVKKDTSNKIRVEPDEISL